MTMLAAAGRKRTVKFNWYNPFAAFETRKDAEVAMTMGGGAALAIQGLGVIVTFFRLIAALQHPQMPKALYAAWVGMAVVIALGGLLTAVGFALARKALWAAVVLAVLVGFAVLFQLGHNWVRLLGAPTLMSVGGAILCVRGALVLKRRPVDLEEVFS